MTIERSFDPEVMRSACSNFNEPDFDYEGWVSNPFNVMYVCGDNVGLATHEYPGVYNAHWFFKARGKEALDIAFKMYDALFNEVGARCVRGITKVELRGARYLAKQLGFVSLGILEFNDGPNEVMYLDKDTFNRKYEERRRRWAE